MPREIVTVQVGQCGNQVGRCFWELALEEHAAVVQDGLFDAPMSSYFRNVDVRTQVDLGVGQKMSGLKARAVLVDTEEGVLSQTMASPIGELFDDTEFIKGVSGAGNNFAHGFYGYGREYGERLVSAVRTSVERCDSIQAFFLLHSTGGGTGSGLGTFLLQLLKDEFPGVLRFTASVLPSPDDDVVTSPYNAALAVEQLRANADCVFPLDNQALMDACHANRAKEASSARLGSRSGASKDNTLSSRRAAFDDMNFVAANMLCNLTSCARFHGKMNVDISELTTNLVPFPHMQFVVSSLSPIYSRSQRNRGKRVALNKQVDQAFSDVLARSHQLLKTDPVNSRYFSCALLTRGSMKLNDLNRNVERLAQKIDLVSWNPGGFKVGHCAVPAVGQDYSVLCLANNACIKSVFGEMENRFTSLFGQRRKAYVHHYTQYMEEDQLAQAAETLRQLQDDYKFRGEQEVASNARIKVL